MFANRIDLSEWVIHFIHDKNPENDPREWGEEYVQIPVRFINGKPEFSDRDLYDEEYPIEPDGNAYQVLKKILNDGYLKAGWSYRNGKPTIYGPNSAVCFTEMPLYALMDYTKHRKNISNVNTYGIALLRNELFESGGRPVIYGLSGEHKESRKGDIYFGQGLRCLDSSCGIGLSEQYRYVAMNLKDNKRIDWSHEREWRWPYTTQSDEIPGLPIWIGTSNFTKVLVIVQTSGEAKEFLDLLKEFYDSGYNNYGCSFDKDILKSTWVLALEDIDVKLMSKGNVRIEDLPLKQLSKISPVKASKETLEKVRKAVDLAKNSVRDAVEAFKSNAKRDKDGHIIDAFGFAHINTYESHTEVTQALIELGYAEPIGGKGYYLFKLTSGIDTEGVLSVEEVAAQTAAKRLEQLLGQRFYVEKRWD